MNEMTEQIIRLDDKWRLSFPAKIAKVIDAEQIKKVCAKTNNNNCVVLTFKEHTHDKKCSPVDVKISGGTRRITIPQKLRASNSFYFFSFSGSRRIVKIIFNKKMGGITIHPWK